MRSLLLVATAMFAGDAIAQMPLPAFGNTFTSTLTRGFWFQAPVPFVITGLQVPNEAQQAFQVVEVIDFGAAPPPAWPTTATGTQLFYDNATPTGQVIPCSVLIPAGNFIGILGACNSFVGSTTSYNSYAATSGPFASDILGNPTQITRFGTQFGIGAGGNNPCWSEAAFQISRVEVYVAPAAGYAAASPYGAGCIGINPLAHTTSARPIIGTSINLNAGNVPQGTVIGLMLVGLTQLTPGIDLTFLGMPGCFAHTTMDASVAFVPTGSTGSVPFTIPADPGLAGFALNTQAATFTPGINAFGFVTSNGMHLVLDLL